MSCEHDDELLWRRGKTGGGGGFFLLNLAARRWRIYLNLGARVMDLPLRVQVLPRQPALWFLQGNRLPHW